MKKAIGILVAVFTLAVILTAFNQNVSESTGVITIMMKENVDNRDSWISIVHPDQTTETIDIDGIGASQVKQSERKRINLEILSFQLNKFRSNGYSIVASHKDDFYTVIVLEK
jgi:hypothetical protein